MKRKMILISSLALLVSLTSCNQAKVEKHENVRSVEVSLDNYSYLNTITARDLEYAYEIGKIAYDKNPNISDEELEKILISSLNFSIENHPVDDVASLLAGLNKEEILLALKHPIQAFKAKNCADIATSKTNELYDSSSTWKGNGDAFRHCYWNVLMTKTIGKDLAEKFATAHEADSPEGIEKEMDLTNNKRARELADLLDDNDESIINSIIEHINNGEFLRIITIDEEEVLAPTSSEGLKNLF